MRSSSTPYEETADFAIPGNFTVDELPPPVETKTAFGSYTATCAYDPATRTIRCKRALVMQAAEIPAKDYMSVRQFYETIQKAEQAPVVLSRVK